MSKTSLKKTVFEFALLLFLMLIMASIISYFKAYHYQVGFVLLIYINIFISFLQQGWRK